jgi:hypothetical protein
MIREQELAGLAMTLGRDHRMKITVGGEESYCTADGSRINIAKMPATPLGRTLMTGLVFHEVGHKGHTQGGKPPGLLGDLTNIIEDVRVEALTLKERPGTRYELDAVTSHYVRQGALYPKDLPTALCALVMAQGRLLMLRQDCIRPMLAPAKELLERGFGAGFVDKVEAMLGRGYPRLTSTADAEALAKEVIDFLENLKNRQSPQEGSQEAASEDQNQTLEEGPSQPLSEGPTSQEDPNEGSEQEESKDGTGTQGQGRNNPGDAQGERDKEAGSEPGEASDFTSVGSPGSGTSIDAEAIEQMVATGAGGYGDLSNLLTRELDTLAAAQPQTTTNVLPEFPLIGRHRTKGDRLDEVGALSASSRMRARLLGLLQSVRHQPDAYSCSGRKLACQRLVRLSLGDPKVFRRRVESKAVNTAVMILLDLSGSMASRSANEVTRAAVASLAAFALHHCLSGLAGVKVSSAEFSSRDNAQAEINILADFGEKPQSSAFNIPPDGGTPTHSGLWYARAALLQRPEPRRIILILTDGSPCSSDQTMDATRRCLRDGIEIVAIGVLTDAVQRFWENNQVITSVADLPKAMFEAMEELLVGRERKCLR